MLALGCIQSRRCNTDKCPTGITTQNPARYKQLDVTDKGARVANYHHSTLGALTELLNILGLRRLSDMQPKYINRRINQELVMSYEELYPCLPPGFLMDADKTPEHWQQHWQHANAVSWR
jgi:hypothetical protein